MSALTSISTSVQKGKARANSIDAVSSSGEDSDGGSLSSSSSASESSSRSNFDVSAEYLESLLAKAKQNVAAKRKEKAAGSPKSMPEEETIQLEKDPGQQEFPPLDTSGLLSAYFSLGETKRDDIASRPLDAEAAKLASASYSVPAPPVPPPELTKSGKKLTKKEKKALNKRTAGPDWFDLPAPAEADLPRLYREVEALRLRNQLDPKRFYKKDEGEGKGIKGLPKYFAIGTIIPSSTSLATSTSDNLTRAHRKRTLVDELVDDAEAKHYAKKKFGELQAVRGMRDTRGKRRTLIHKRKR